MVYKCPTCGGPQPADMTKECPVCHPVYESWVVEEPLKDPADIKASWRRLANDSLSKWIRIHSDEAIILINKTLMAHFKEGVEP